MARYANITKASTAAGAAAASAFGIWVNTWLKTEQVDPTIALVTAVIVIPITQKLFSYGGEQAFAFLPWLRRWLLGNEHVEGIWIDVVYENKQPVQIGVVCIEPNGSTLAFHGETHDLAGCSLGSFRSDVVSFSWPKLMMVGWNDPADDRKEAPRSYCEIQFTSTRSAPEYYSGFFTFIHEGQRFVTRGWRVSKKEHLWALTDRNSRQQTIVMLAQQGIEQTASSRKSLQAL